LISLLCMCVTFFAMNSQAKTYQLRIATHLVEDGSVGQAINKLGELMKEYGEGKFNVIVYKNGVLGDERVLTEMTRDASIEVCTGAGTGPGGYVPQMALFEMPFMAADRDHLVRIFDTLNPDVTELLAPFNLKPMGSVPLGFRVMLNKERPIYMPEDLVGLKMRAPNPLFAGMFVALGAGAATVNWNEVYAALQTGVVDGMEAPAALIYSMKFQEQASYLSLTNHIVSCHYFIVRKDWYDSLPSDLQAIFDRAIQEASQYGFEVEKKLEGEAIDKLKAEGVKVNDIKDLNAFQKKCLEFRDKYVAEKGSAWEALYRKMLDVK